MIEEMVIWQRRSTASKMDINHNAEVQKFTVMSHEHDASTNHTGTRTNHMRSRGNARRGHE